MRKLTRPPVPQSSAATCRPHREPDGTSRSIAMLHGGSLNASPPTAPCSACTLIARLVGDRGPLMAGCLLGRGMDIPDDRHSTMGVVQQLLTYRAEEETGEPAPAARADDDQLRLAGHRH